MAIESQLRIAIRDAVNQRSRKPFHWGGLVGYQQLDAIGQALRRVVDTEELETAYLQRLAMQVNRTLEANRALADDLQKTHTWVRRIADCLRYPSPATNRTGTEIKPTQDDAPALTSQVVAEEMEALMQQFSPDLKREPAQAALYWRWHRIWETTAADILPCYDIPGLPQDNLQLEGLFGRLRRHQRRISGRKSTCELRDFGQYQVLFLADSEEELLQQLRQVPLAAYYDHRRRLADAEAPRQFLHRLHRNPATTIKNLLNRHEARRTQLADSHHAPAAKCAHTG